MDTNHKDYRKAAAGQRGRISHSRLLLAGVLVLTAPLFELLLPGPVFAEAQETRETLTPEATDGVLDLRHWDSGSSEIVQLKGQWHFYWDQLLPAKDWNTRLNDAGRTQASRSDGGTGPEAGSRQLGESENSTRTIEVPNSWTLVENGDYPSTGRATYRLELLLPEGRTYEGLALSLPTIGSAFRLYVNGEELAGLGTVNSDSRAMTDAMRPMVVRLPALGARNEILFHVSNVEHARGGLWQTIEFGDSSAIEGLARNNTALNLFLSGGLFLMSIYHLGLFLARRKETAALHFGLFCLLVSVWTAQNTESLIQQLFPAVRADLPIRIEYLAFYSAIIAAIQFCRALYPEEMPRRIRQILIALITPFILSGFFLPLKQFVQTLQPVQFLALATVILVIYWNSLAIYRKRMGARLAGISFFVMSVTVVHDIMLSRFFPYGVTIAPFGMMFFIVGQAFALSVRLSRAFNQLEDLSQSLEARVQERTSELDTLNDLTRRVNESQDLEFIVGETSRYMIQHLGMRRMFLWLIDPDRNEVRGYGGQLGAEGDEGESDFFRNQKARIEPSLGTLYRTIQKKRTLHMDLRRAPMPRAPLDRRVVERFGMKSILEIPAMVGDRVLGVVVIDPGDEKLTRAQITRLEGVVAQIAGAANNAQLIQQINVQRWLAHQEQADSELLAELAREANQGRDAASLLGPLARILISRLGADRLGLWLARDDGFLHLVAGYADGNPTDPGQYSDIVARISMDEEGGVLARGHREARTIYAPRINRRYLEASPVDREIQATWKFDWFVNLPLLVEKRSVGIIAASGPHAKRIPRSEIQFLERAAATVAGATQKQILLDKIESEKDQANALRIEAEREKEESELLAELARETNQGASIEELLSPIYRACRSRIGARNIALYLADESGRLLLLRAGYFQGKRADPGDYAEIIRMIPTSDTESSLVRTYLRGRSFFHNRMDPELLKEFAVDRALHQAWNYDWAALVPLTIKGRSMGIIAWSGEDKNRMSRADLPFLESVADIITGAIHNLQLLEKVKEKQETAEQERNTANQLERETRALAEFTRLLNERQDLDSIVQEVCRFATESLQLRGAFITVINQKEKEFQNIGGYGSNYNEQQMLFATSSRTALNPEAGTYYRTYERKKPLYLPRLPELENDTDRYVVELLELKSYAHIPLLLQGEVIGIMGIDPGDRRLKREDLNRLQRYADQVTGAINNAALLKQVQQQRMSIEGVARITEIAASTDDLDEILDQIFSYVHRRYGIASGLVMLPDKSGRELISYRVHSVEDRQALGLMEIGRYAEDLRIPLTAEGGTLVRTFLRGRPFYVPDAGRIQYIKRNYPGAETDREIFANLQYKGYLALPMKANNEPVALLNFTSYGDELKLSKTDREELGALADQLAGIIRARQLADNLADEKARAEKEKSENEVLANLARKANEGADIQDILFQVTMYTESECGVSRLALWLVDEETDTLQLHSVLNSGSIKKTDETPEHIRRIPIGFESGSLAAVVQRNRKMYLPFVKQSFLDASPVDNAQFQHHRFDWFLHVPLSIQGSVIGVASFAGGASHRPDARARLLMERMIAQIAGSVYNRQLLSQVQAERNIARTLQQETEGLNQLLKRIAPIEDLDEIMAQVMKFAEETYNIGLYSLYSVDNDTLQMHCISIHFPEDMAENEKQYIRETPIPLDYRGGAFTIAYRRSPRYTYFRKAKQEGIAPMEEFITRKYGITNMVVYPLMDGDEVMAFLNFMPHNREELNRERLNQLSILSDQISGIIRMNGLIREVKEQSARTEEARKEIEALAQITRQANESADLEQVFHLSLSYVQKQYGIEGALLLLADSDGQELHYYKSNLESRYSQQTVEKVRSRRIPLDHRGGVAYHASQRDKPTYFRKLTGREWGEDDPMHALITLSDLKSAIAVPLKVKRNTIGLILFSNYSAPLSLSKEDIAGISRFAEQIAGTIYGANLLEQAERERSKAEAARKETEILAELSKKANEATDLGSVSQALFDYLRQTLELDDFCLFVLEQATNEIMAVAWDSDASLDPEIERWLATTRYRMEPEIGTLYRTYTKKKSTYLPSFPENFSSPGDRAIVEKLNLTSALQVPLIIQEEVIGFFTCGPRRRLRKEEIHSVERFCNQVAGAVRATALLNSTARARARAEEAKRETETLAILSREANETVSLENLSQTVFDLMRQTLGLENFTLFIVDDQDSLLLPAKWDTIQEVSQWKRDFRVPLQPEIGTLHRTWRRQRTLYMPGFPEEFNGWADREIVENLKIESVLQIPLVVGDRVVGIFACGPTRKLNRDEIRSAERYIQQIAGAVRVIALLQATQEAREEAVVAKEEAEQARTESDTLLDNVLPRAVARELKETGHVEPVYFDFVSVLFTDFVGFTKAAANLSPAELIQELDGCFSQFDEVSRRNNMEKLKTIGDAYMCAGGLPIPGEGHAIDACLTALEFRSFMKQMAEVKGQLGYEFWQIRIGIHSGPVTAGVIGKNKFAYDIWGDTVNVASRMESSGSPGMVNISGTTYELVKDLFECEYRGKVQAKGKGEMDMYFVHRIRPELSADDEGLLPNAMFEMARTDLDMEELDEIKALKRDASWLKAKNEISGNGAGSGALSNGTGLADAATDGPGSNGSAPAGTEKDRRQSDRRAGTDRRKPAGARPLSELDKDRQGW